MAAARDFTFRGRNMEIQNAFTARSGRVTTGGQLYDFAPLPRHARTRAANRPVPRGAAVAARKHQKRKTPDRRYKIVVARYPWTSGRGL